MPRDRPDPLTLGAFLTISLFWGLNFPAVRYSNLELAPFWGATLRFAIAALLLALVVVVARAPWPRGRALGASVVYGVLAFAAVYAAMYWALVAVPGGTAAVVFATVPLITFVLALVLGLERFRWRGLVGAVVVILGIALVAREGLGGAPPMRFVALVVAATSAAASGIVVKRSPRVHPLAMNAIGMGASVPLLAVASVLAGETVAWPRDAATQLAVAWLITSSILAFVIMVWVIGRWTVSAVSYAGVLVPVVAVPATHLLMGDPITSGFLFGAGLVLVGVYVGALHTPAGVAVVAAGPPLGAAVAGEATEEQATR